MRSASVYFKQFSYGLKIKSPNEVYLLDFHCLRNQNDCGGYDHGGRGNRCDHGKNDCDCDRDLGDHGCDCMNYVSYCYDCENDLYFRSSRARHDHDANGNGHHRCGNVYSFSISFSRTLSMELRYFWGENASIPNANHHRHRHACEHVHGRSKVQAY